MENEQVEYRAVEFPAVGGYRAGSDGSVDGRWVRRGRGAWCIGEVWRPLKQGVYKGGYRRVRLHNAGLHLVNRIVCAAFHGPPPSPKHEASHLDDDPANNRADNLAWETREENQARRDRKRHV